MGVCALFVIVIVVVVLVVTLGAAKKVAAVASSGSGSSGSGSMDNSGSMGAGGGSGFNGGGSSGFNGDSSFNIPQTGGGGSGSFGAGGGGSGSFGGGSSGSGGEKRMPCRSGWPSSMCGAAKLKYEAIRSGNSMKLNIYFPFSTGNADLDKTIRSAKGGFLSIAIYDRSGKVGTTFV